MANVIRKLEKSEQGIIRTWAKKGTFNRRVIDLPYPFGRKLTMRTYYLHSTKGYRSNSR